MIELQQVAKSYGRTKALEDLSLALPIGKVFGIIGENGSGKTTLLKLIAGLITPQSGRVTYKGEPITRRIAKDVAYMPDIDQFFPYFTVQQLFAYYESQFEDFQMVKAKELAQFLHVSLDAKMKDLSKGNRGRAKIAATLGRDATYYVLDEPFSGLDPMVRADITKGLIQFTDLERQTLILSTHEIKETEPLLDEVVVVQGGKMIAQEAVDVIRDEYGVDTTNWMVAMFQKEENL